RITQNTLSNSLALLLMASSCTIYYNPNSKQFTKDGLANTFSEFSKNPRPTTKEFEEMSRDIGCTTKRLQERFRNLRQKAKKQQQQQNAPLLTTQASAEVHLSSTDPVEELPPGQLFLRELEDVEELNKSLIVLPDKEMQRTVYLGAPPNTFSISIVEFQRSGRNRDPTNRRAWVRCRGSSIFNFDCFSRWQIMLIKHTEIKTQGEPSMKVVDIPTVYDSRFQLQLNCWYNCTRTINSDIDKAMNYRQKRITLDLKFVGNDLGFDLQAFTFTNRENTISGYIRWIPKLIANDERYRNKIHEVDNYESLAHVQPIPFTTKRLREISQIKHTTSTAKLDDDLLEEEDEYDQDPTSPDLLSKNVDDDDLDDAEQGTESSENGKWSLFDIKIKEDITLTSTATGNIHQSSSPSTSQDTTQEKSLADNLQEELTNTSLSQQVSMEEKSISITNLDKLRAEMESQQQKIKKTAEEVQIINKQLDQKKKENQDLENELAITKNAHMKAQRERERQSDEILKLEEEINQLQAAQKTAKEMKQKADREVEKKLAAAQEKQKLAEAEKERKVQEILDFAKKIKDMEANNAKLIQKNETEKQNLEQQLLTTQDKQKNAEKEKERQAQQISELDKLNKELQIQKQKGEQEKAKMDKIEKSIIATQYNKIETQIARDFLAPKQLLIIDHMKKIGQKIDEHFIDRLPKMVLGEVTNGSIVTYSVTIVGFQDHHAIFKAVLERIRRFIRTQYWKQYVKSFIRLLQDKANEYTELFNHHIEDIVKSLTEKCILNDLTTIKAEIEQQTNNFIKDKSFTGEIEPPKHQALEEFIEQNIILQRSHHEKKPTKESITVLETFVNRVKTDFKTNRKYVGHDAKHFDLIPDILQRLIIYYCCFNIQLPLFESALELLDKIDKNTVTTIATSTGSGKSTLLPALLAAEGYDKIIVTQPRRLPCTLICQRVNETTTLVENPFSEKLAGWAVSGAEKNPKARVLYVTDGLLKERLLYDENFITRNTQLDKSIIFFIDEVHERSVNIDHCLALLARMLSINPDLKSKMKLIISSATLDSSVPNLFRQIKGITLAEFVMPQMGTRYEVTKIPRRNENILNIVQELYQKRRRYDQILCFVSSVKDVNECCSLLKTITGGVIIAYPLIQSQQASTQNEYIENGSVFFSTTVAETSLTFPQLKYVVDTGYINIPVYDPDSKRTVLKEDRAAESTIKQRLGRLGRTQPGEYYSLYDFTVEDKRYPTPQICQSDLTNIEFGLRKSPLKQGMNYMKQFFPDHPPNKTIVHTVKELRELGILESSPSEKFTAEGEALAKLPDFGSLAMSKCVWAALTKYSCGRDLIYISSILSVLNTTALLKSIPQNLKSSDGDFMTLFNVMQEVLRVGQSVPGKAYDLQLICQTKGLTSIQHILRQALRRYKTLERSFKSSKDYYGPSQITSGDWPSIAKSLLAGYYENVFVSLKELYRRNHHYVRYDSSDENIAVLDSQSSLARHISMTPVPVVLARDIRYASSIRSRAVLSFLGELQPEWVDYQLKRNVELNSKELAHLNDKNILTAAKAKFHKISMLVNPSSKPNKTNLLLDGSAGTSLTAELHLLQQLAIEQPEFSLENKFLKDSTEYINLSRNLESVIKMPQIFKPMTWRWEAEKQVKITVNPNTSTKTITVKVVGRDSEYENVKKEFNSFLGWLGHCAVIRHPNSGVPPRVFRPQVRAKYHDIEERISHITDPKRTPVELYKSIKGPNATRETRMEAVAWIAVCKFSCKLEGGFVRDWVVGNYISRPANPLPSPKDWIDYVNNLPYMNREVVPADLDCHLPTHCYFDIEKFQDELHKYNIACRVFRQDWRYVLLIDEDVPTGPYTMDLIEPHVALTHDRIDFDVNNLSLEKDYTHELAMRVDIQQRPYFIELETIVDNIKNKRFQILRPIDTNVEQRVDKMVNIRHWTQIGQPFLVVPNPDPKYWSVLVRLPSSDKLYKTVEAQMKNIGNVTIISIEQIKNPLLEDQYEAMKKIIAKQCTGFDPNERELFHGTSGEAIDGIRDNGFDDRYFSTGGNWGKKLEAQ
ncbi:unnamed protein product, partial [Rotaria sordida]